LDETFGPGAVLTRSNVHVSRKPKAELIEDRGAQGVSPTESNILPSVADFVSKAGQGSVSLICSEGHRLREDVPAVYVVIGSERVVDPRAELVIISSIPGINDKIGRPGTIGGWDKGDDFRGHRVDAIGGLNNVLRERLASAAVRRIRARCRVNDLVGERLFCDWVHAYWIVLTQKFREVSF